MIITSHLLDEAGFDHGFGVRRTASDEYPDDIHILRQVHGERIIVLSDSGKWKGESGKKGQDHGSAHLPPSTFHLPLPKDHFRFTEGDALITDIPGTYIGIRTADCLPILVADPRTGAVAAIHCGWRSAALGLAEMGVRALAEFTGSSPKKFIAAMGPAIGPCHFEVGTEVKDAFAAAGEDADAIFEERGQSLYLDLPWACSLQLQAAGIKAENIDDLEECTLCERELYYSFRGGDSEERMVSFISSGNRIQNTEHRS
jgi:YfiH family protein